MAGLIRYAGYETPRVRSRARPRPDVAVSLAGINHREEELLSYLTGLAAVGQPFEASVEALTADLDIQRWAYAVALQTLIERGFVRKIAQGYGGFTGVLVVLRRLEAA